MNDRNPETQLVLDSLELWKREYLAGSSCPAIAKKYGVDKSTVYRQLKRIGVRIRTKSEVKMSELNPMWLPHPSSQAIHLWVKARLPKPEFCTLCNERKAIDLANISHTYNIETYTRELKNWRWLCRKCHMVSDGRLSKMYHGGTKRKYDTCMICIEPHHARKYCVRHYQQYMRLGRVWL